jgi:DnaJ-class molecular chaperone
MTREDFRDGVEVTLRAFASSIGRSEVDVESWADDFFELVDGEMEFDDDDDCSKCEGRGDYTIGDEAHNCEECNGLGWR